MTVAPATKTCCVCKAEKQVSEFTKNTRARDGMQPQCRPCRKIGMRLDYERHRAAYIARAQRIYADNKDLKREFDYRRRNAAKLDALKAEWRTVHAEKVRQMKAAYKKRYPHLEAEHAMRRNARKRQATPMWLTREHIEQMRLIYLDAATRSGGPWHVDHIVPLKGTTVCGLHVPWNLQIISARENASKGNRLLAA